MRLHPPAFFGDTSLCGGSCDHLLRIALALAFLSAVADRFGLWGKPGSPGVSWANMTQFNAYVAKLNWFLPTAVIPLTGLGRDGGRALARFGVADRLAIAMGLFG
jgi:hypothetical protein